MKAADIQSTLPLSVESPSTERDHWRTVPLRDVIFHPDYGVTASATPEPVGPKFLRITDIGKPTIDWDRVPHCRCSDREKEEKQLRNGDLVVARIGATTGITYLYRVNDVPAVFASYLIRIRCRETFSPEFLYQISQSPLYWDQVDSIKQGRLKEGINTEELKSLMIPLPPLSEQHRIATVLATVDEAISAADAVISAVVVAEEQTTESLFSPLLGLDSPSFTGAEARPDEGYPLVHLTEILSEKLCAGYSGLETQAEDGVDCLTLSAVTKDDISKTHTKKIVADRARVADLWIRRDDIFIERSNTYDLVGLASIYERDEAFAIFPDLLIRVRVDAEKAVPKFIARYLRSRCVRSYFARCAKGTSGSMKKIDQHIVGEVEISLPPLPEQRRIVKILSTFDDRLALERAERDRLVALKKGLMQVLLTGKVRVPPGVAEEVAPAHA